MTSIPFFYYDIVARIFPGAVVLAVLVFADPDILGWASGQDSWKTVVVPLALAGGSYAVGVLFEVIFSDWGIWECVSGRASEAAAIELRSSSEMTKAARDRAWNALLLASTSEAPQVFAHALRFWAEAKMCLHSLLPVLAAAVLFYWNGKMTWSLGAVVVAMILFRGVYSREKRRWIQVFNSIPPTTRTDGPPNAPIQRASFAGC